MVNRLLLGRKAIIKAVKMAIMITVVKLFLKHGAEDLEVPEAEAVVRQLLTIQTGKGLQLLVQILAEINIKILKFIAEEEPALKLEGTLL